VQGVPSRTRLLHFQLRLKFLLLLLLCCHVAAPVAATVAAAVAAAAMLLPLPAVCEYVWRQQQESYTDGPCLSSCSKM
jgi:L-alanine-DL-glutamate epimerase-like enolase superfamily enzyme